MKRLFATLLILTYPLQILANPPVFDIKYVQKGQTVGYDGYLMTPETEKNFRLLSVDFDYYKALNTTLTNINNVQANELKIVDERIKNKDEQIGKLTDRLASQDNFFSKLGMFMLGAGITMGLAWGLNNATK